MYLDFRIDPGANLDQLVPEDWTGLIYTLSGQGVYGKAGVHRYMCTSYRSNSTFERDVIAVVAVVCVLMTSFPC